MHAKKWGGDRGGDSIIKESKGLNTNLMVWKCAGLNIRQRQKNEGRQICSVMKYKKAHILYKC